MATLNAGKGGAHASYYHRANKQVQQIPPYCLNSPFTLVVYCKRAFACVCVLQIQVGVEFEASTRTQETTTSFGYQMELPEANMVFRGKFLSATLSQMSCSMKTTFFVCVSRYDKQSVHNRRCVGEASNPSPCHPDHGCLCKSQR